MIHFDNYVALAMALDSASVVGNTKELINVGLELKNPDDMFFQHAKYHPDLGYFSRLLAWYLRARPASLDNIDCIDDDHSNVWKKRICQTLSFGRLKVDINSNYGAYIWNPEAGGVNSQFDVALERLMADKLTRQAILLFNRPSVNVSETADQICTTSLQFLIRDLKLHLIVTMRSNDLYGGTAYDIPFFMTLQEIFLSILTSAYSALEMGSYLHNVGSLHVYERDWKKLKNFANNTHITHVDPPPKFTNKDDLAFMLNIFGQFAENFHFLQKPDKQAQKRVQRLLVQLKRENYHRSHWHINHLLKKYTWT